MKTSAIVRIVVWLLVALLLTWLLVVGISGGNAFNVFSGIRFNVPYISVGDNDSYTSGNAEFDAGDVRQIEVEWVTGNVEISVSDTDKITIGESSSSQLEEREKMVYRLENGILKVRFLKSGINTIDLSKSLEIKIPESAMLAELSVSSVTAPVTIDNIAVPELDVESVSADVTVTNCACSTVDIHSVNGDINVQQSAASEADMEAISGGISVEGAFNDVSMNTTSGRMDAVLTQCPQELDAESVSGNITVTVVDNDGFIAEIDTVSGSMICGFEGTQTRSGIVYKNGAARFDFETVSGNVSIKKAA